MKKFWVWDKGFICFFVIFREMSKKEKNRCAFSEYENKTGKDLHC
ncbi:hypothetical protein HMPREF9444_01410 [Succinatimonas hippei YIT 12066]|uniref:Uncharacterized protein n=1 Tax=Succinatimonas hippei (strain DSM 22608 / JCM 16073 / KCTC 15190 / YIT 12066) TaxID=762983 RepID=E8LL05_SUCHY|nr:hypothetical protein HMPREF9444_01410 [Succinatimonas hippei YIT 12066]